MPRFQVNTHRIRNLVLYVLRGQGLSCQNDCGADGSARWGPNGIPRRKNLTSNIGDPGARYRFTNGHRPLALVNSCLGSFHLKSGVVSAIIPSCTMLERARRERERETEREREPVCGGVGLQQCSTVPFKCRQTWRQPHKQTNAMALLGTLV